MNIQERLFQASDKKYAEFQMKITPTVRQDTCIGVRVPEIRKLAKELIHENAYDSFLKDLPHQYYDENMLHGVLLSEIRDFDVCIRETDRFLPYVDNWAVCDIMSPKVFKTNKVKLLKKINEWIASEKVYTCRFGIEMLMSHFLDSDYRPEYLLLPASVQSDEYYVNMMIAWFFATALSKQWETALPILRENRLSVWVHNKTIQKARESFRISSEQKEELRSLKR